MITKKEFFIFSMTFLGVLLFILSGGKDNSIESISFDTKEDRLLVDGIKYKNIDQALNQKKRNNKNNKDLRVFRKRLTTNNLNHAIQEAKSSMPKQAAKKASLPNVAKKKEDKKKEEKKKKIAKKKSNLKPMDPLSPSLDKKIADDSSPIESAELASLTYTQNPRADKNTNTNSVAGEEGILTDEQKEKDESVSSFQHNNNKLDFQKSIFTELLESERLAEFEQLLNSELNEKQRIQSYQDSLNFLFSQNEENFQSFNSFIRNQFFNDKHAVIISKSLNNPKMTFEQVRYSVAYLNQMVIEWSSEDGNTVFKTIYQDNVQLILSQNEERRDLFTGLQSSIEAKSLLLAKNTIEVSAN